MEDAFSTGQLQWRKLKTEFPFIWIQETVITACLCAGGKGKILNTWMLVNFYSSPVSGRKLQSSTEVQYTISHH